MAYKDQQRCFFGRALKFYFNVPNESGFEDLSGASLVRFGIWEQVPTVAQISAGTGAQAATTAWTAVDATTREVIVPLVNDPDPSITNPYKTYYFGIAFKWNDAGNEVYDSRAVTIWRPQSTITRMSVNPDEIIARMTFIDEIGDGADYVARIAEDARTSIYNTLMGKGYDLERFNDIGRADLALKHKTLELICVEYATRGDPEWLTLADRYSAMYQEDIAFAQIGYDLSDNKGDDPDGKISQQADIITSR